MSETDRDLVVEERERLVVTTNYSGGQDALDEDQKKEQRKKRIKWIAIIGILLAIAILIIVLCVTLIKKDEPGPDPGPGPGPPTPDDPFGYQEFNQFKLDQTKLQAQDWYVKAILKRDPTIPTTEQARLQALQANKNGYVYKAVNPKDIVNDPIANKWADNINLTVTLVDNYRARIQLFDQDSKTNYQVSDDVLPRIVEEHEARLSQLGWYLSPDNGTYFQLGNIYTNETILSTQRRKLLISEKFSEIGFVLPTKRIFGLGQRNAQFQLTNGTYQLWSKSAEKGLAPDDALYQSNSGPHIHPFILCQTANPNDFFGMYFVGTAAQTFEVIYYTGQNRTVLNYITSGGNIEFYFIMRGTAYDIIKKYHAIIGYSAMPPYYALGLFQGSSAYKQQADVDSVLAGYSSAFPSIPLEGFVLESYNTKPNALFTVSPAFKLSDFQKTLKGQNKSLILGLDGALNQDSTTQYFKDASTANALLVDLSTPTKANVVGFQGDFCVYYDFFNVATEQLLGNGLTDLYKAVNFDGLVFRHNNNFNRLVTPDNPPTPKVEQPKRFLLETEENLGNFEPYVVNKTTGRSSYRYAPFVPGFNQSGFLDNMTVPLGAAHGAQQGGSPNTTEFFIHNANGHLALKRVTNALKNTTQFNTTLTNKRAFVFSESTAPGSGNLGGAIITDQYRSWENLNNSLSQVMAMSMFGVSNVVTDICGSLGPMDEDLCFRWAQLSVFLPMARSYYNETYYDVPSNQWLKTAPSELFRFTKPNIQASIGGLFMQRLQFTRYIYSQMYQVYREGGPLIRPLFFDYPGDNEAFKNVDNTFMLGDALKVSPVLFNNKDNTFKSYFPKGRWFDLNGIFNLTGPQVVSSAGEYVTLTDTQSFTNVHLKEGNIVPYQEFSGKSSITTQELQTSYGTSFYVFRDQSLHAEGYTLIDDGISRGSYDDVEYTQWKLRYGEKSINFWLQYGIFNYSVPDNYKIDQLTQLHILDAADLNDTNFACYMGSTFTPTPVGFSYSPDNFTLTLKPLPGQTLRFKDIGLIKFGDSRKEPNVCNAASTFSYKVDGYAPFAGNTGALFNLSSKSGSPFVSNLIVTIQLLDNSGTLFINLTTQDDFNGVQGASVFKVPDVLDQPGYAKFSGVVTKDVSDFFTYTIDPFSYAITEEGKPQNVVYQSDPSKLYMSKYLVMDSGTFSLNKATGYPLMGMGEAAGNFFYNTKEQGGIHSRWAFDNANPVEDGLPPGKNMYGVQPFYQFQSSNTEFYGVFMLNSYAMDFLLDFNNGTNTRITNIMIGGAIQKFIFRGKKLDDLIVKYERLTGMPTVPPLWSFGWQQCRFGWVTDQDWYDVVTNYTSHNLPLDTMWADIDYLDDYKLFTISPSRYGNLTKHVKEIRAKNMTFVPIMDAGVAARNGTGYHALDRGHELDVWIKRYDNSGPLTAGVWCGNAYFPDFFKPATTDYWHEMLGYLNNTLGLEFDGIWLDENEATNFCNGYCDTSERPQDSLRNKAYYVPGWRDLEDKALGVDGLHANGLHEYDVHNLFALTQVKATASYFTQTLGKRPYVLSRSNFPGITKYGHTWIGDNWSTVEYMKLSVDGLYSYQLFGLPFMGCDICGFNGDAAANLCTKWHQLGSLYPFARNHNQNATQSQEPYRFDYPISGTSGPTYTDLIRTALRNRYSFVHYYYSSFQNIGDQGGSFFKPLMFEFPNDPQSYKDIQINILLGNALKASIQVTTLDALTTQYYFPGPDTWCQILPYYSLSNCVTGPINVTLPSALSDYQLHLRETYILPFQNSTNSQVNTTKDLSSKYMDLLVLPAATNRFLDSGMSNATAAAFGHIYYDDGVSLSNETKSRYDMYLILQAANSANFSVNAVIQGAKQLNTTNEKIGTIKIMKATTAQLNGAKSAKLSLKGSQTARDVPLAYDATQDLITLTVSGGKATSEVTFHDLQYILITPN